MIQRSRPRVLDVADRPRHEAGNLLFEDFNPYRLAIVAHYSEKAQVSLSVQTMVEELVEYGFYVVLSSSSVVPGPLVWPRGLPTNTTVLRRPNVGYDFGSWAAVMDLLPTALRAPVVLLLNDSQVGPFTNLEPLLTRFETTDLDVVGMCDSTQEEWHLQSYWVGYRGGVLAHRLVRRFWRNIRIENTKDDIIARYEIGGSRYLSALGYRMGALFPYDLVVRDGFNPTSFGWRRLLAHGYPFVKREMVLTPPELVADGTSVREVIMDKFDQDVMEWV